MAVVRKTKNTRVYTIKNSELYSSEKYDFASAIFDDDILATYTKSGLHEISTIIQKELSSRGLLDSLFIELNIIGTLLEEKTPNVLNSLTFIREGYTDDGVESTTPLFADNVKLYSNPIIRKLYKKFGYTIFYHPDIFIDQGEPKVPYSIIDPHAKSKAQLSLDEEIQEALSKASPYHELTDFKMQSDSEPSWVSGPARILVGNSRFQRDYEGIVKTAVSIRELGISVQDAIHEFHRYYHYYFAKKRRTVYMAIPILGAYSSNRPEAKFTSGIQGQGVVFLFFTVPERYPIYRHIEEDIDSLAECLFERIGSIVRLLTYNYLFNLGVNLANNVKKQSIKSAIAAIMSRNMSHNLGSHYLYYTKSYLEDLADNVGDLGPDIRGAAKVLGYMQARMDYLATIISNDRYPNGSVNFKSQIYDELTVDDFSKRHFDGRKDKAKRTTNFLLSNLILSENFTRSSINFKKTDIAGNKDGRHYKPLRLQVMLWEDKKCNIFTGSAYNRIQLKEKAVKNELSKLNIALPGGTMSTHAFFNVLENFIRNSAKYMQSDFKEEGLVFTISIKKNAKDPNLYDFIIFDNKNNADKVLPIVNKQLMEIQILDEFGGVEKSSKGLKEMLFSSVWMRTYNYPTRSFADIISLIHRIPKGEDKLQCIKHFGFDFVSVSDNGVVIEDNSPEGNLGLHFSLPEFKIATDFEIEPDDDERDLILKSLSLSSDIVCFNEATENTEKYLSLLSTYFTRCFTNSDFEEKAFQQYYKSSGVITPNEEIARLVYKFKIILDKRFGKEANGNIDKVGLVIGDRQDIKRLPRESHTIYFERHLNTQKDLYDFIGYAYADSVSGGNFTITLNSLMDEGITKDTCRYKTWHDKLLGLKIKESALTRITLIDERLFNNMKEDGPLKELEYQLKNIRVLSASIDGSTSSLSSLEELFEGNTFQDGLNRTHFLSIHLGLIEKIIKSDWGKRYGDERNIEHRALPFMQDIIRIFSDGDERVFITIHSGRGNFSKELEGPLANYPFISLSAIENAFNNSKYLLSQLFYNTLYIGKGIINKQD